MTNYLPTLLATLFTLYAGVMSWLFKTAWADFKELKKDHEDLKEKVLLLKGELSSDFNQQLTSLFDKFLSQLDERFDSWWNKIECNLMNEGRLPPKTRKKAEKE